MAGYLTGKIKNSLPGNVKNCLPNDVKNSLPYNVKNCLPKDVKDSLPNDVKKCLTFARIFPDNKHSYNTIPDHMPENHRFQAEWTPERLLQWADKIGQETAAYIEVLLSRRQHPEQNFRLCLGILKFADKYGKPSMEKACRQARELRRFSYKDFKILIENLPVPAEEDDLRIPSHQNIRGRDYYRKVVNGGVADVD